MKAGDWIACLEGYGQVLYLSDYFIEEYRLEYLKNKEIGAPLYTLVVYKILCDFDGKIRKRNKITASNSSLCRAISRKGELLVNDIKNKHSDVFEKFIKLGLAKPLSASFKAWFFVSGNMTQQVVNVVNQFNNELTEDFTFDRLILYVNEEYPGLDLFDVSTRRTSDNVCLVLFNENYRVAGKRALFSGVKAFVG